MRVDEKTYQSMPDNIKAMFRKLPNPGSEEVMAVFPNVKAGIAIRHRSWGNTFGGDKPKPPMDDLTYADSGSAARFFKSCPVDNDCILCYNPSCKDITTEEICKIISANCAEGNLKTIQGIIQFIVQEPVKIQHVSKLAQNVLFAENLCASCGTNIALALVGIKLSVFNEGELQVMLDYIGSFKGFILIQNLVSFAELWENIGIIPTTKSLSILFGSVNHAITNYTPEIKKSEPRRFIYTPKASRAEREAGLEGMEEKLLTRSGGAQGAEAGGKDEYLQDSIDLNRISKVKNHHPTVKPLALMRYLCRLITPPGGTILDPFMGSGTTGMAAKQEGFNFIGIEKDPDYFKIAGKRVGNLQTQPNLIP